jgi:NADP-dependent 3-hydroxy acid dehydrogenase YdfG
VDTLALDARDAATPAKVFERITPDVLVIGGGAFPPTGALHELSWDEFSVNWENDARIAFNFLKAVLTRPLPPGSTVVLLSSGAGFAGSPNTGGYAGAKRTQIFMANYAQKESHRLALGLRFVALAPRIIPDTELGKSAIAGYARYLGVTEADFVSSMSAPPSAEDVAQAVMKVLAGEAPGDGHVFIVSGQGLQPVPT